MRLKSRLFAVIIIVWAAFWHPVANSEPLTETTLHIRAFDQDLIWRRVEGLEYPNAVFTLPIHIFAVHSTLYWDKDQLIAGGISRLKDHASQRKVPFHFLVSRDEKNLMNSSQTTMALPFEGDAHFYRAIGTIVFAGGNFTECLCNAIRSSIIQSGQAPLSIKIITDATYEIPFPSTLSSDDKKILRPNGEDRNKLSDLISFMPERAFLDYLRTDWLSGDGLPCPLYVPALLKIAQPVSFLFNVEKNGRFIGSLGKQDSKSVTLDFLSVEDFIAADRTTR